MVDTKMEPDAFPVELSNFEGTLGSRPQLIGEVIQLQDERLIA